MAASSDIVSLPHDFDYQYPLARRWAEYLVSAITTMQNLNNQCVFPKLVVSRIQISSRTPLDETTSENLVNLALKGIIGIQAMAEISRTVGNSSDADIYEVSWLSDVVLCSYASILCRAARRPSSMSGSRSLCLRARHSPSSEPSVNSRRGR